MDTASLLASTKNEPLVVDNWPMSLEATRTELENTRQRLERYRAALRLADSEIRRRNRSIVALTTFAHQANSAATPTTLLKLALAQAMGTLKAPVGAILLIEPKTKDLTLGVHRGLTPELSNILTGGQLEGGAISLMPHLVVGDGALLEAHTTDDETELLLLTTGKLTSLVSLPLQVGSKLSGALLVGLQDKRFFTPAELHFLTALSQGIAMVLDSLYLRDGLWYTVETILGEGRTGIELQKEELAASNLEMSSSFDLSAAPPVPQSAEDDLEHLLAAMMEAEDEVQQHNTDLQTLNNFAELMNRTLNLDEILQCTVDQTYAILKTDAVWLYLVDERHLLEMQAHTGLSIDYVRGMQHLKPGHSIEGRVMVEKKAYFVESVSDDVHKHKIWVDKEQLHALAAVPITRPELNSATATDPDKQTGSAGKVGSHVIGVLATGKRTRQSAPWSPRDIRLLTSIANQVALAIDNARLYAHVQEGEAGLKAGNQVLQTINDMLLEKNVYLEGFILDELIPELAKATQSLQYLLAEDAAPLPEEQKQKIVNLQRVVSQLSKLANETGKVSEMLDTEFDKVIDGESKQNTGPKKPIRLEKKADESEPVNAQKVENSGSKPMSSENDKGDTKPLSFEEAIAAGLVPSHIMNRETDEPATDG
jgi:GAF domain-containing protein